MCGRIAQTRIIQDLTQLFGLHHGQECMSDFATSYNVAPGTDITVLLINRGGNKSWDTLKWGIMPEWVKTKRSVINARAETVHQKPMFKNALHQRRILIPVTAYYEWRPVANSKQPYCIRKRNGAPLLLAGLYTDNECAIITRPARQDIEFIHNRMPVIIDEQEAELYLDREDLAYEMLMHNNDYLSLDVYPVTKKIGNPIFDEPLCLEPIDLDGSNFEWTF